MISTLWTDRLLPSFRGGRGVSAKCVQRLIGLPRNPSHQGEPPWPRSHPQLEIPFQAPIASISPAAEISGAYLPNGSRAPTMSAIFRCPSFTRPFVPAPTAPPHPSSIARQSASTRAAPGPTATRPPSPGGNAPSPHHPAPPLTATRRRGQTDV